MRIITNEGVFDGDHESTKAILNFMKQTDFKGKDVIDVGCGSGILTLRAYELGARHIVALDFDSRATDNTRQNLERNHIENAEVFNIDFKLTDLKADIILANLPREEAMYCMPKMKESLNEGGLIITSWWKELPTDELLVGWDAIDHFKGEDYDCYVLKKR
jgi:ribosomal protein L11 methyltransferase